MALTDRARTGLGVAGAAALVVGVVLGLPLLREGGPQEAPDAPPAETVASAAEESLPPTVMSTPEVPAPEAAPEGAAPPPMPAPTIDIVRFEPDGSGIVAGQAAAGITVAILIDGGALQETVADADGRFVDFLTLPASAKARMLSLVADPGGAAVPSDQTVLIAPTPEVVAAAPEADAPAEAEQLALAGDAEPGDAEPGEAGADLTNLAEAAPGAEDMAGDAVAEAADAPSTGAAPETTDMAMADASGAGDGAAAPEPNGETLTQPEETAPLALAEAGAEAGAGAEVAEAEVEAEPGAEPDAAGAEVAEAGVEPEAEGTEPTEAGVKTDVAGAPPGAAEAPTVVADALQEAAPSSGAAPEATADVTVPQTPDATGTAPDVAAVSPVAPPDPASPPQAPAVTAPPEAGGAAELPSLTAQIDPIAPPDAAPVAAPGSAPILLSDASGVRVLQPARPAEASPEVLRTVALDAISYDASGEVTLAGRATTGGTVRLYLDNAQRGDAPVQADGTWTKVLEDVPPGLYTLRADQIAEDGRVVSRIETPFLREERATIAAVLAEETQAEDFNVAVRTVQPGNTLWAIARERYGEGILYVAVFEANKDLIRDPDLIYPGQIFRLPEIGD